MASNVVEQISMIEKVGKLHLKSYKPAEIARELDISTAQAKHYVNQYRELVQRQIENDPDFLDRIAENTLEALERLDQIIVEAHEAYETAKHNDFLPQQINLLKVLGGFEQQRANYLQLMGAKMDGGMIARMNKAERVNEVISLIIKEVVAQCDHCKEEVMPRLAEAFALMNKHDEAAEMRPVDDDILDAEVVEEEEEDAEFLAKMNAEILSDD